MNTTVQYSTHLETHTCGKCGIPFAAPAAFWYEKRRTGEGWYCPNGHGRVFAETEADRLKRKLAETQTQLEWAKQSNARKDREIAAVKNELHGAKIQTSKARNELKRTKDRIANGMCPCCRRSFVNLQRHMQGQHPNYAPKKETA